MLRPRFAYALLLRISGGISGGNSDRIEWGFEQKPALSRRFELTESREKRAPDPLTSLAICQICDAREHAVWVCRLLVTHFRLRQTTGRGTTNVQRVPTLQDTTIHK